VDVERELKYSTTEAHVPSRAELEAAVEGTGLEVGAPTVERYVDVYFDTPTGELRAAGVALRQRHRPSGAYATLKGTATQRGDLYSRPELEVPLDDGQEWPAEVLVALPPLSDVAALAPVAELWVERVRVEAGDARGPLAELAFDAVECRSPGVLGASVTFNEVEVEALSDEPDVEDVMRALADAVGTLVPLTPSSSSKLERALALLAAFA